MEQGTAGKTSHIGESKALIKDRIKKYGDNVGKHYGEGLSWGVEAPAFGGTDKHAFMIMVKILGQAAFSSNETNGDFARNVWSQKLNKAGVFTCMSMNDSRLTVLEYADAYVINKRGTKELKKWSKAKKDYRCPLLKSQMAKTHAFDDPQKNSKLSSPSSYLGA